MEEGREDGRDGGWGKKGEEGKIILDMFLLPQSVVKLMRSLLFCMVQQVHMAATSHREGGREGNA